MWAYIKNAYEQLLSRIFGNKNNQVTPTNSGDFDNPVSSSDGSPYSGRSDSITTEARIPSLEAFSDVLLPIQPDSIETSAQQLPPEQLPPEQLPPEQLLPEQLLPVLDTLYTKRKSGASLDDDDIKTIYSFVFDGITQLKQAPQQRRDTKELCKALGPLNLTSNNLQALKIIIANPIEYTAINFEFDNIISQHEKLVRIPYIMQELNQLNETSHNKALNELYSIIKDQMLNQRSDKTLIAALEQIRIQVNPDDAPSPKNKIFKLEFTKDLEDLLNLAATNMPKGTDRVQQTTFNNKIISWIEKTTVTRSNDGRETFKEPDNDNLKNNIDQMIVDFQQNNNFDPISMAVLSVAIDDFIKQHETEESPQIGIFATTIRDKLLLDKLGKFKPGLLPQDNQTTEDLNTLNAPYDTFAPATATQFTRRPKK